jgi:hypothetical protein
VTVNEGRRQTVIVYHQDGVWIRCSRCLHCNGDEVLIKKIIKNAQGDGSVVLQWFIDDIPYPNLAFEMRHHLRDVIMQYRR